MRLIDADVLHEKIQKRTMPTMDKEEILSAIASTATVCQNSAENVRKRIDFDVVCVDSEGAPIEGTERPVTALFNQNVISSDDVRALIAQNAVMEDDRVIVTTPAAADAFCWGNMQVGM